MPFDYTPAKPNTIAIRNALILHDDATKMIQATHYPDGSWRVDLSEQPRYIVEYLVQNSDGSWDIKLRPVQEAKPVVRVEPRDERIVPADGHDGTEPLYDCPHCKQERSVRCFTKGKKYFECAICQVDWDVAEFKKAKLG
jgi:hypothetical protein